MMVFGNCANGSRRLERVAAPVAEPVSLAEAKLYLRVDASDEDTLITEMITAARMLAEQWLGKSLMEQRWRLVIGGGAACVALPMGPVALVQSVALLPEGGGSQSLDETAYRLNAARDALLLDMMPVGEVEIIYDAGYGDAADVPAPIRQGLLAHVAAMYDLRAVAALPPAAAALYAPYREVRL